MNDLAKYFVFVGVIFIIGMVVLYFEDMNRTKRFESCIKKHSVAECQPLLKE